MAANRFGIDVGGMLQDVEAIKGARIRNKAAELQLSENERVVAERPEKEKAASERKNMLTELRQKYTEGDDSAGRQYLAVGGDPSFIDAVSKMDDKQVKQSQQAIEEKGSMLATIRNASPEKQPLLYKKMRLMLDEKSASSMPEEYDPNFVELSIAKLTAMDKILENPKSVKLGGQNILYKGGQEIERADIPTTGSTSSTAQGGLKSGDESLMYRQSAELLGGLFDQAGNITNLDPTVRNKVQGIATEASKIFKQGGVTRTQAVKMAANKFGLNVQEPGATSSTTAVNENDPLGIR